MKDTMNPQPLAQSRHTSVEEETPKSQLIKEWIDAVNANETKADIQAAVTLYCIRCKQFDPSEVVSCVYNGCALWPCRTRGLILDKE